MNEVDGLSCPCQAVAYGASFVVRQRVDAYEPGIPTPQPVGVVRVDHGAARCGQNARDPVRQPLIVAEATPAAGVESTTQL